MLYRCKYQTSKKNLFFCYYNFAEYELPKLARLATFRLLARYLERKDDEKVPILFNERKKKF